MLHARFTSPSARSAEATVVQLPERRVGVLDGPQETSPLELLAADHPVLLLLDEVERLRSYGEDREAELTAVRADLSQAYDRECDLVRILHRYVLAEQATQERRRWWPSVGRTSRS